MPKLIFLSRLALICNICYILSFLFSSGLLSEQNQVSSTIIVLGVVVSFVLNAIVHIILLMNWIRRRKLNDHPLWLIIFNFLAFVFQIFQPYA